MAWVRYVADPATGKWRFPREGEDISKMSKMSILSKDSSDALFRMIGKKPSP